MMEAAALARSLSSALASAIATILWQRVEKVQSERRRLGYMVRRGGREGAFLACSIELNQGYLGILLGM